MKVLAAKIHKLEGYANPPKLQILVDRLAHLEEFRFRAKDLGSGETAYLAELNGQVEFFLHNPRRETGFGGSVFHIVMEDGSKRDVKGPWSSRAGVMGPLFGLELVTVDATDRREDFDRGYTFRYANVTLEVAQEAMSLLPGWTLVAEDHSGETWWEPANA